MTHTCHATNCTQVVVPALFMCRTHWYWLPKPMRDAIWKTYRKGQELDKQPSAKYLKAAQEAIAWIENKEREKKQPLQNKLQGLAATSDVINGLTE